jgi:hypothetical protein
MLRLVLLLLPRAPQQGIHLPPVSTSVGHDRPAFPSPRSAAAPHGGRRVQEQHGALHAPRGEQAAPPGREPAGTVHIRLGVVNVLHVFSLRREELQVIGRNVLQSQRPLDRRQPIAGASALSRRPHGLPDGPAGLPERGQWGGHGHGVRGGEEPVHHGAAAASGRRGGARGRGVAEASRAAVHGDAARVVARARVRAPLVLRPRHRRRRFPRRDRGLLGDRRRRRCERRPACADALGVAGAVLPPKGNGAGVSHRPRCLAGLVGRQRRGLGARAAVAPGGDERRGEVDALVGVGHAHDRRV